MLRRPRPRFGAALCLASAALVLAGCAVEGPTAPTSVPVTPTYHPATPAPVSDADVEAAIAGFEQYVQRLNELDPADQATIDTFLASTSGEQLAAEQEFIEMVVSRGWRIEGTALTRFITATEDTPSAQQVSLEACVDTSALRYLDATGAEHGPPDGSRVQLLSVQMRKVSGEWLVDETSPLEPGTSPCE